MNKSKNILLVTNAVIEKEVQLVKEAFINAANLGLHLRLSLVHVIPNLPTCYFSIPSMAQLAEQYYSEAKHSLMLAGESLGVAKKDQWLITGRVKTEVLRLASKLDTQFILASSANIQELHQVIQNKQFHSTQLKNITTLAAVNF